MTIYIIAAALPFVLDLIFEGKQQRTELKGRERKKKIRWFIVLACIPMAVILGLRGYRIGTDTIQYVHHFRKVKDLSLSEAYDYSEKSEPGLYLLMYFCSRISTDPSFFLCVDAIIVTTAFAIFAIQNNDGELLTIVFHVTLGSFLFIVTGMRQGLAISFCLLSIEFIRKKKLIPFAILIFLAFYTHRSSIMFVMLYLIGHRKLTFGNMAINLLASFLFVIFFDSFQSFFNDALEYGYDMEETGNGGIFLAIVLGLNFLAFLYKDSVLKEKPDAVVLYNGSLIAAVLWVARLFSRTAERPSYYFLPCTFAIAAMAIQRIKNPQERVLMRFAAFVLSAALLIYRLSSASTLAPFKFYWTR